MNQALEFIKAHTLALACGVVALIAIGAFFFFIPGLIEEVRGKVNTETIEPQSALDKLAKETRTPPKVNIDGTELAPLVAFPTQRMVDAGTDALNRLHTQAAASLEEVSRANVRLPLVPNALPEASSIAKQGFLDAYKAVTAQTGNGSENGIIRTILKGALPPTPEELRIIGDARANQIYTAQLQRDASGKPVNQQQVDAVVATMRAELETQQRIGRARTSKIYVNLNAVDIHPFLSQSVNSLTSSTIFNAQMSLWLQQIAFEAIADANSSAHDVFDAPVKHLIRLDVPMEVAPLTGAIGGGGGFGSTNGGGEGGEAAAPAPMTPDATAAITPTYLTSPYGYGHNSLYDAIPITLTVRLDVRQLPQVLSTLGHGRLLKINNVNIRTVDTGRALAEKYIYDRDGKTPLVEARIECDVLFLRTWLAGLMPVDVKAYFLKLSNPTPAS